MAASGPLPLNTRLMKRYFRFFIFLVVIVFADSCATNPVSKRKQVVFMSEEKELQMGKEADPQIIAEYGLYDDKSLQDFINEKGKQMAAISHRPNIEYNFRVVDSDILNAFAIPGGYVYFTRGIMAYINNEAEFAGVLGHEIGHIAARHSVEQQRNQIFGQVGLIGSVIFVPALAQFAEPLSQGLGLLMLKFGRDAERESDRLGVEYSSKIGYDASEMAEFFHTLERQSATSGQGELPEFLSTHPNPGDRNVTVAKLAKEWKKKLNLTDPKVNRNIYLKRIDGIIYGEDPRQGYVESSIFYHPQLKFQFAVPAGWQYQNTPTQVQMVPKDGKAIMILTAGKGGSLQEAAGNFHQQNRLQVMDSKETEVNGLKALAVLGQQQPQQGQQQQQVMQTLSYFIQYGENIYLLMGAAGSADFQGYSSAFTSSQESFKALTDQSRINKKPERVRVHTVSSGSTLKDFLAKNNVPEKRLEEHAILNGMQLKDQLESGTLIKVISE
jgi:predicted Zn-dependent protease